MPYTPTSPAGIALAQLRRMVTLSAAFRTGVGAVDEEDAVTFALIGQRPLCDLPEGGAIVYMSEGPVTFELQAGGAQLWLHPVGILVVQLLLKQPDELDAEERYLHGVDFVCNTMDDIKSLSDAEDTETEFGANHLAITRVAAEYAAQGDIRFDHSRGKLFLAKLFIEWGIN